MELSNVREFPHSPDGRLLRIFKDIQKQYTECEPKQARIYRMEDLLLYRAQGILSPGEQQLALDASTAKMLRELMDKQWQEIKPMIRQRLQPEIEGMIGAIGLDVDPANDELVIIVRLSPEE